MKTFIVKEDGIEVEYSIEDITEVLYREINRLLKINSELIRELANVKQENEILKTIIDEYRRSKND